MGETTIARQECRGGRQPLKSGHFLNFGPCQLELDRMDPQDALALMQQALITALLVGAPLLLVGMLVGLLIGLAQALTQIQDQTVAFVPKLVAMVVALLVCLPWLTQKMVEYSSLLIANIPKTIMGG
jgi:flagellar biosynthesis protein FliQ